MICPECGNVVHVKKSVITKSTIERYRQCVGCEKFFYTKEVFVPDSSRFRVVQTLKEKAGSAENYSFDDSKIDCGITANEYQRNAWRTANQILRPKAQLLNGLLGLCGEAGEAADILKKHLYQGHELDKVHLAKELGDVAWYLAISAKALGYDLDTILQMNIDKLRERYPKDFDPELSINRKAGDI